jgi:LysM repeat protein
MAARSPLRLLAPIALALALLAVIVVVASSNLGSRDEPSGGGTGTAPAKVGKGPRTYVVKQGDTLLAISEKTGVSTETLVALNRDLDPQVLRPGDRLRLR